MAKIQINEFPEKINPEDADVVHLKADGDGGDYKTPISALKDVIVTDQIATTGEATAGTDDSKIMTPIKTVNTITGKQSSKVEAEAGTSNDKLMTPLRTKEFLDVTQPKLSTLRTPTSGGGSLTEFESYLLEDSLVYTLPSVTGFVGGEEVSLTKRSVEIPEVVVEGSESEKIRINSLFLDTSIEYDINSEIIFTYNILTNEWEV